MRAPAAANNLTSPAPVAPNRCPGSINARPSTNPSIEAPTESELMPIAANARPDAASPAPAASVPSTINSDGLSNGAPEDGVDGVAHGREARHRDDDDQRHEQS